MRIWGIHKKYKTLSWWENFMGGHFSIGPLTIFGANAMNWTAQLKTRWGYLCFTLPVKARWRENSQGQKFWQWYIYLSPNGTPWACTWYRGSNKSERIRANIRRINFGHGFSTDKNWDALYTINNKFSWFMVNEYDIFKYGPKEEN